MSLELDHLFCFCDPELPEVAVLENEGFVLTSGRKHVGQGTANRSVMFDTNYLELIFLESEKDALLNPLKLHLRAYWKTTGQSPIGIALRGEIPEQDLSRFWDYSPPYFPELKIKIHHFNELHPEFPLLFVMPTNGLPSRFEESLMHKTKSTNITQIRLRTPLNEWPLSEEVKQIKIEKGFPHHVEVHVDGLQSKTLPLNGIMSLVIAPKS
jgi:hypothetical protein